MVLKEKTWYFLITHRFAQTRCAITGLGCPLSRVPFQQVLISVISQWFCTRDNHGAYFAYGIISAFHGNYRLLMAMKSVEGIYLRKASILAMAVVT